MKTKYEIKCAIYMALQRRIVKIMNRLERVYCWLEAKQLPF